jgi:hypothetical protein
MPVEYTGVRLPQPPEDDRKVPEESCIAEKVATSHSQADLPDGTSSGETQWWP